MKHGMTFLSVVEAVAIFCGIVSAIVSRSDAGYIPVIAWLVFAIYVAVLRRGLRPD